MFKAFKKLTTNQQLPEQNANILQMSQTLQKRFSRGVQYNMKIIIRGDKNVGKSCLFERLQGKAFRDQYTPTEQIQVAPIQWNFKNADDVVKVEVWDIVDEGKPKASKAKGLKLVSQSECFVQPILDANFLDVYKGTNGVLLMFDITKQWTFDYVVREVSKIPEEIPVLILGNHCDMGHHRVISLEQALELVEEIKRKRATDVLYTESSMKNGFGLRVLYQFLGLPFLQLKRQSLLAQLDKNEADNKTCVMELTEFMKSDNSDYSKFIEALTNKRREAPSNSNVAQSQTSETPMAPTKSIILGRGKPIVPVQLRKNPKNSVIQQKLAESLEYSRNSGIIDSKTSTIRTIDDFCPEEASKIDMSFLEEDIPKFSNLGPVPMDSDSDDNDKRNPLVAHFDDDFLDDIKDSYNKDLEGTLKTNPLTKGTKTTSSSEIEFFNVKSVSMTNSFIRRSSSTSLELKERKNDNLGFIEIDSDSSKLTTRRSPDGIEDFKGMPIPLCALSRGDSEGEVSKDYKEKNRKHKKKGKGDKKKKGEKEQKKKSKDFATTSDDDLESVKRQDSYEMI